MTDAAMTTTASPRPRLMDRYRAVPADHGRDPVADAGRGRPRPLVHAERLGAALGLRNLYLKVEGQNPTGSFKDRGMVMAVAKAAEAGATAIVCASTGNTSASAAAYGAAAGMEVIVVLPKGQIAIGKLLQALVAGARVVAVDGNFDQALSIVRALAEQDDHPVTLVNSVNPFRIEGQKTAAFEICDDLGRAPDILAIPVGNAGNISAYWAGFSEYRAAGVVDRHTGDVGIPGGRGGTARGRPSDRAPGDDRDRHPDRRSRVLDEGRRRAGRVGRPDRGRHGRRDPGAPTGRWRDTRACSANRPPRPAWPGITKAAAAGEVDPDAVVVCVLTGHGLKDPTTAERQVPPFLESDASVGAVAVALGW